MSDAPSALDSHRYHPSSSTAGCRRAFVPPQVLKLPQLESSNFSCFTPESGLRTPPSDGMSTTYHPAMASAYDANTVSAYSSTIAHSGRSKVAMVDGNSAQYPRYVQQQHPAHANQQRYSSNSVPSHVPVASAQPTRPVTPKNEHMMPQKEKTKSSGAAETLVYHSLQLPRCINMNGGNLAEFAAQVRLSLRSASGL